LNFPRRGKIHVLKDAVASATGEVLVFSEIAIQHQFGSQTFFLRISF